VHKFAEILLSGDDNLIIYRLITHNSNTKFVTCVILFVHAVIFITESCVYICGTSSAQCAGLIRDVTRTTDIITAALELHACKE
jgi:hypothetical protein